MIKKIIIAGVLCLFSNSYFAQKTFKLNLPSKEDTSVSPIVKENIEHYARQINTIIQEEKVKMENEIKKVTLEAEKNGLSNQEIAEQKAKIADSYSDKIDKRINDLGFNVDEIIQKQVKYSLLNTDATSVKDLHQKLMYKFRAERSLTLYASFGVMGLTNNLPNNDLDNNKTFSNNFEFGIKYNRQFSMTSPWGLVSGLGFSWRTLRLENDKFFTKDANNNIIIAQSDRDLQKSKLRTGYIMVPIGLQYNFSPIKNAGEDVRYRSYFKGFKVGAGLYGGIQMSTNNIVKGDGIKYRHREEFNVNPFVYGAQFYISYNKFNFFIKKDFSNYFKDQTFKDDKMIQFGILFDI
ncbi:outer membrane beta-barrel protein [Elizabethkingia ursingii]|uniref:outer membrane beta-barrel protein n=1 Tax=Elizabethkingia ursingii TaxID=1756150 RepID=UPI000751856E|nr:outer membrane beta-barrel protein [Elizabethkingia ursingii]KUY30936.1 hypothetical protein ATB96_13710 [Elizabethkingia ursingii]